MSKRVASVQSSYIPWKGYFDLINAVDEFILYDEVQYTTRDWRNRNRIKTGQGCMWLSIPVSRDGGRGRRIKDVTVSDPTWSKRHWKVIAHNYARARYFADYKDIFQELYSDSAEIYLSRINYRFLRAICGLLGIKTQLSWSTDYRRCDEGKTKRLIDLCRQAGGSEYISGPSARSYLDEELFRRSGITLRYIDYSSYPEYRQLFPPFEHHVSIIDLLFNEGPNARRYMLTF